VRTTDSHHSLPVTPTWRAGWYFQTSINFGLRYYLHPTAARVCLPRCHPRRLQSALHRLALSRHIDTQLTLKALHIALANRSVPPGLIHHSDRGVQYAAADYVAVLQEHKIQISMSRTGNPYDNAKAERFMRTLKYEEVYLNEYDTLAEVLASVQHFIEAVLSSEATSFGHRLSAASRV
jgi:branched-subunit amino acid aminotransferase/4-amino-4-deoxychorismate lyase